MKHGKKYCNRKRVNKFYLQTQSNQSRAPTGRLNDNHPKPTPKNFKNKFFKYIIQMLYQQTLKYIKKIFTVIYWKKIIDLFFFFLACKKVAESKHLSVPYLDNIQSSLFSGSHLLLNSVLSKCFF